MSSEASAPQDIINASIVLSAVRFGADSSNGDTLQRLCTNTSAAIEGITAAVSGTVDYVSKAVRAVTKRAHQRCAALDKRLCWELEEMDANKLLLEACERQLRVEYDDYIDDLEDSVRACGQLIDEWDRLPTHSCMSFVGASACAVIAGNGMSRVQLGVDAEHSVVSHPDWLVYGEGSVVTISPRDMLGQAVKGVMVEDVTVGFIDKGSGWVVNAVSVEEGSVRATVTPSAEGQPRVTLTITLCLTRIVVPLRVCDMSIACECVVVTPLYSCPHRLRLASVLWAHECAR